MRNPLSDKAVSIPWSGIRKFFDVVNEMPDAISLGVGEPDFDTPWHIRDEGIYSLEKGRTFYTSNAGLKELREEIVRYLERRIHVSYDPLREVLITVGGSEGIDMAFRAMLNPGDEVLIPQPCFVCYEPMVQMAQGVPVIIETKEENSFRLTPEELLSHISPKTKMLILPYPNNPTGVVYSRQTLEGLAELLRRKSTQFGHPIYLIADEPYRELVYDGVEVPFLPTIYPNTLVCYSYSKSLSLPGERIGYVCVPSCVEGQADVLHAVAGAARSSGHVCPPTLVQLALQRCADARPDLAAYDANRRLLYRELTQMGYECIPPQGAFYLFVRVPDGDDVAFSQRAKLEHDLLVVPSTAFHCPGFLRLSYCVSHDMILRSLPAFRAIREKYQ